jgi:hypothetical protein
MNSSSTCSGSSPRTVSIRARTSSSPTVDDGLRQRRDHVLLLRGARLRRHQGHAEHRLGEVGGDLGGEAPELIERRLELDGAGTGAQLAPEHALEEGDPGGVGLEGGLLGQLCDQRRQPQQRVVPERRHRPVPGATTRPQREPERPLLADAERVEALAAKFERGAAALVDDEVGSDHVRVLLAEPLGSGMGAGLLVGGDDDLERPPRRPPAVAREMDRGRDLGRDLVLHVLGAAPADHAVDHIARPRVEAPLIGIRGDCVHVGEEAEGGTVGVAAEVGDQVGAALGGAQQPALEAGVAQARGEKLLRRRLVARRVDGVEADQLRAQLDGFGIEPVRACGWLRLLRPSLHAGEVKGSRLLVQVGR